MSIRFLDRIQSGGGSTLSTPRFSESISEPSWTSLNLVNGWADAGTFNSIVGNWNYGSPPAYRFLPNGVLELRGLIRRLTQPSTYQNIATIPSIFPVSESGSLRGTLIQNVCFGSASSQAQSGYYLIHGGSLLYGLGPTDTWFSLFGSASPSARPLLFLGDKSAIGNSSLGTETATYRSLLSNQLGLNQISNVNASYSFQDVSGIPNIYDLFQNAVTNYPLAVVIDGTLNDLRGSNSLFTPERYELKLSDFVRRFIQYTGMPTDRIVLCGPGIISQFQGRGNFNSGSENRLQLWRESTRNVARSIHTRFADFYKSMQDSGIPPSQLTSGDLYTRTAHVIMKDAILDSSVP